MSEFKWNNCEYVTHIFTISILRVSVFSYFHVDKNILLQNSTKMMETNIERFFNQSQKRLFLYFQTGHATKNRALLSFELC